MKKIVCLTLLILSLQVRSWAAEFCNTCEPANYRTVQSCWEFSGFIETGMMMNQYGQKDGHRNNHHHHDNYGNSLHLENVRHSSFQMNQLWLQVKKERNRHQLDIGGLVDFNYGVDAFWATGLDEGWGKGNYFMSLPQMYVEIGKGDFSVSAGKFFTEMGLNSTYATERFFHSTSYEFQSVIDYCAIFATWDVSETFNVFSGWTNGEERFFTDLNHNAFLSGMSWRVAPRLKLDYIVTVGKNDDESKYFASSLLANLKRGRWDYSFIWILRNVESLEIPGSEGRDGRYGINQELYYTINDRWSFGMGAEWLKHYCNPDEEHWNVYAVRLGTNWKPRLRLTLRSEIRYDKFDGFRPFNGESKAGQFLYGFSGVMTF